MRASNKHRSKGRPHAWLALVDAQICRLVRCDLTRQLTPRVCDIDHLENNWIEHEHGRPMPRTGKNGHSYAGQHHQEREKRQWFAQRAAAWLKRKLPEHGVEHLVILAAPQVLGDIRRVDFAPVAQRVTFGRGHLANLCAASLARHPAVRALLSAENRPTAAPRGPRLTSRRSPLSRFGRRSSIPRRNPAMPAHRAGGAAADVSWTEAEA